jgi:uncharacterized membrane protein YjjP (DUF1212 family)
MEPISEGYPATHDQLGQVLATTMHAGQILLENGASTARVEETVQRMGRALGAEQVEVFATPTGLFATHAAGAEHRTRVQRIGRVEMDLSKIEATLRISRAASAGRLSLAETQAELVRTAAAPAPFNLLQTTFASALCCGCTAGLFGGNPYVVGATAAGAALGHLVAALLARVGISRLMATGAAATAASGLGLALALGLQVAPATAMLSSIMMLTPGVLIVSAVADLFGGDTLAGLARAAMALLSVTAIAAGVWLVLALSGAALELSDLPAPGWPATLGLAAATTAGFAMLFGVPARRLPAGALAGALAYAAYRLAGELGAPPGVATFAGGLAVGLAAEALARLARTPASLFSIPGIITLVPGAIAFRTMLAFAQGDIPGGAAELVRTGLLAFALAAGLGVATALAGLRLRRPA